MRLAPTSPLARAHDLIIGADMPQGAAFQLATRHIWQRFGHPQFPDEPHLAMPFAEYERAIYGVVSKPMPPTIQAPVPGYEDHGVFIDLELNGKPVGGMVSPLGGLGFGDALWNFEFWNNIRDANGMVYWGECSGIFTGLADAARFTGSGIIDLDHGFAVGTDGINLSLEQRGDAIHLIATGRLARLKKHWENPYELEHKVRGKKDLPLYLNESLINIDERADGLLIRCMVAPDGSVSIHAN